MSYFLLVPMEKLYMSTWADAIKYTKNHVVKEIAHIDLLFR